MPIHIFLLFGYNNLYESCLLLHNTNKLFVSVVFGCFEDRDNEQSFNYDFHLCNIVFLFRLLVHNKLKLKLNGKVRAHFDCDYFANGK